MKRTTALRYARQIDYAVLLAAMIGLGAVAIGGYRMVAYIIERLG